MQNYAAIQQALRDANLDGWLFFDHHRRDPLAYRVLRFEPAQMPTRRWYYLIPAEGEPVGLVHAIEANILTALPGEKRRYSGWRAQVDSLRQLLHGCRSVAMQYSPLCAIPYISMIDGGTIELIRSCGVEIRSSADLIQRFESAWDEAKLASHLEAGRRVDKVRAAAFEMVRERLQNGAPVSEIEVKDAILANFAAAGLVTDHGPIVAVNANAANPHYEPSPEQYAPIQKDDLLLLDMWAKLDHPGAAFYDITWVGYCGLQPPADVQNVFDTVRIARDAAIDLVQQRVRSREALHGFEVDDAARQVITNAGFGQFFVHRTGHSIGEEVHGTGANMDNLETHDERLVMPMSCFSVEPGIYLDRFGIRLEVDVFVDTETARVTGERQTELVLLA